jgi:hypothetical protein
MIRQKTLEIVKGSIKNEQFREIGNKSAKWNFLSVCRFRFVHYDFRIKTMFGSSFPPIVCRKDRVLCTWFVFVCLIVVSNTYRSVFLFCLTSFLYGNRSGQTENDKLKENFILRRYKPMIIWHDAPLLKG